MPLSRRDFLKYSGGGALLGGAALQSQPQPPAGVRVLGPPTFVGNAGSPSANGRQLQAAIDAATDGGIIELNARTSYEGPIILRARSSTRRLLIRTRGYGGSGWPAAGFRVTPSHQNLMANITAPMDLSSGRNAYGAVHMESGARGFTLEGLHISGTSDRFDRQNSGLIFARALDNPEVNPPGDLTIAHCLVRGHETYGAFNGIRVYGDNLIVKDCHVDRVFCAGADGQVLEIVAGRNHLVQNCLLEGGAETVIIGGITLPRQNLQPQDIAIKWCTIRQPSWVYRKSPDWIGRDFVVKNLFEVKGGRRITVDGCDFVNYYSEDQIHPWVITLRRGGSTWMDIRDVTFRNCRMKGTGTVLNTLGHDDLAAVAEGPDAFGRGLTLDNCLFYDIDSSKRVGAGMPVELFQIQFDDVRIQHCTWWRASDAPTPGWSYKTIESAEGSKVSRGFVFRDNLGMTGVYNARCSAPGNHSPWAYHFCSDVVRGTQDWTCTHNVLGDGVGAMPPQNNQFPSTNNHFPSAGTLAADFVDWPNGNFRLKPSSPYKGAASDGKDPGVDMDRLAAALANIK